MTKETETFTYYRTKDGSVNLDATLQDVQQASHPGIEFPVVEFHTHSYPEHRDVDNVTSITAEAFKNLLKHLDACGITVQIGDCVYYNSKWYSALLCAAPYDCIRLPYIKYYIDCDDRYCFIVLPSSIRCENQQ